MTYSVMSKMFSLSSLIQYPCVVHMRTYLFGELFNSIETLFSRLLRQEKSTNSVTIMHHHDSQLSTFE